MTNYPRDETATATAIAAAMNSSPQSSMDSVSDDSTIIATAAAAAAANQTHVADIDTVPAAGTPTNTAVKYGKRAYRTAHRVQSEMLKHSKVVKQVDQVVRLGCDEVLLGDLLGSGTFCHVTQVHRIECKAMTENTDGSSDSTATDGITTTTTTTTTAQIKMQQRRDDITLQSSDHKYAIKFLRNDLNPDKYCLGAAELVVEMNLLSNLNHANLIGLHGVSKEGPLGFQNGNGYFFIIDRLHNTLDQRLAVWRDLESRNTGTGINHDSATKTALLLQRLQVGLDLSSVLAYLHANKVLYRGIDPRNCAFNDAGRIVLFDLGLARELEDAKLTKDGINYELSGNKGSLPYMAPEVGLCRPYGTRADVYGMSILLWQLCTLSASPFPQLHTREQYLERIIRNTERPSLDYPEWPETLQYLMRSSWAAEAAARPPMKQFHRSLQHEMEDLEQSIAVAPESAPPVRLSSREAPSSSQASAPSLTMTRSSSSSSIPSHPIYPHKLQRSNSATSSTPSTSTHDGDTSNPLFLAILPPSSSSSSSPPIASITSNSGNTRQRPPRSPLRSSSKERTLQPSPFSLNASASQNLNASTSSALNASIILNTSDTPPRNKKATSSRSSRQQQFHQQQSSTTSTPTGTSALEVPTSSSTSQQQSSSSQLNQSNSQTTLEEFEQVDLVLEGPNTKLRFVSPSRRDADGPVAAAPSPARRSTSRKMQMAESAFQNIGGPSSRRASDSSMDSSTGSIQGPEKKKPELTKKQQAEATKKQQADSSTSKQKKKASGKLLNSKKNGFRRRGKTPPPPTDEQTKEVARRSMLSGLVEDKGKSRRRSRSQNPRRSRARSRGQQQPLPPVPLPPASSVQSVLLTANRAARSASRGRTSQNGGIVWSEEIVVKELEKERKLHDEDRFKYAELPEALLPQQDRRGPGGVAA